eukprot:5278823-Amphidinium_carterae.1
MELAPMCVESTRSAGAEHKELGAKPWELHVKEGESKVWAQRRFEEHASAPGIDLKELEEEIDLPNIVARHAMCLRRNRSRLEVLSVLRQTSHLRRLLSGWEEMHCGSTPLDWYQPTSSNWPSVGAKPAASAIFAFRRKCLLLLAWGSTPLQSQCLAKKFDRACLAE